MHAAKIPGSPGEALRELLELALGAGFAALTLSKVGDAVSYVLASDPAGACDWLPLAPVMPQNAAQILSRLTLKGELAEPVVAVMRPCELRAFVELVKRNQVRPKNLVIVSPVCFGVVPTGDFDPSESPLDDLLSAFWDSRDSDQVRQSCRVCVDFVPRGADVIALPEEDGCRLFAATDAGLELLRRCGLEVSPATFFAPHVDGLLDRRTAERKKVFAQIVPAKLEHEALAQLFEKCIGCHCCGYVCPICYCTKCAFATVEDELSASFMLECDGIKPPPNTLFFHIGRMYHMAFSCVGCGICSDVCPADIPVAIIFGRAGEILREQFPYRPGEDRLAPVPIATFSKADGKSRVAETGEGA